MLFVEITELLDTGNKLSLLLSDYYNNITILYNVDQTRGGT